MKNRLEGQPGLALLKAVLFCWAESTIALRGAEILHMEPAPNMTRAELHYVRTVSNPEAVLVLCPGVNGSGEGLIRQKAWQDFARGNRLGLVGLSFASPDNTIHDGTGYYYASNGAGAKLLEGIQKIYHKDLPILLYGFSGGAHFSSRFEEWMPERVIAWCAYSAGWWDTPRKSNVGPPGIVACGDKDQRYGASLTYFKQGRAMGKPWLWVSLADTGHEGSVKLDDFVKIYFAKVLKSGVNDQANVGIVDIDRKILMSKAEAGATPSIRGWLPSDSLFNSWCVVHQP